MTEHSQTLETHSKYQTVLEKVITISPRSPEKHSATVIFLHGSGGSAGSFNTYVDYLKAQPGLEHVKWLLPQAKPRMITAANCNWPAWFDILQFHDLSQGPWDYDGTMDSVSAICELIELEKAGQIARFGNEVSSDMTFSKIDPSRVVVAGLSQGGAIAVWTGLIYPHQLGGFASLSGRPVARDRLAKYISDAATKVPVFLAHGLKDNVVPFTLGKELFRWLKDDVGIPEVQNREGTAPVGVQFRPYDGLRHWIGDEEWDDFGSWLRSVVPEESKSDL